jgi:cytochrome c oxidase subunit 3
MLGNLDHQLLWPDFKAIWPSAGPGITASPAGTSSRSDHRPVAAAHDQHRAAADLGRDADDRPPRADRQPARQDDRFWMWITVLLGATFLGVQAYEYMHAYRDLNLKLSSGIFGSPSSC